MHIYSCYESTSYAFNIQITQQKGYGNLRVKMRRRTGVIWCGITKFSVAITGRSFSNTRKHQHDDTCPRGYECSDAKYSPPYKGANTKAKGNTWIPTKQERTVFYSSISGYVTKKTVLHIRIWHMTPPPPNEYSKHWMLLGGSQLNVSYKRQPHPPHTHPYPLPQMTCVHHRIP